LTAANGQDKTNSMMRRSSSARTTAVLALIACSVLAAAAFHQHSDDSGPQSCSNCALTAMNGLTAGSIAPTPAPPNGGSAHFATLRNGSDSRLDARGAPRAPPTQS